jgi:hypothetical protein
MRLLYTLFALSLLWSLFVVWPAFAVPTYSRDAFGRGWIDADGDCQDTRQEVLIDESLVPAILSEDGCRVVLGLWFCAYTGEYYTDPSDLDIDHMVPLKAAWGSGAWQWDRARRIRYANDLSNPSHLVAVQARANRQKGAKPPREWLPKILIDTYRDNWNEICETWQLTCKE